MPGATRKIQYRALELEVPWAWPADWQEEWASLEGTDAGGTYVSSTKDCLNGIWPGLRAPTASHSD